MKIYSGQDRARELGFKSYRDMVIAFGKRINLPWNSEMDKTSPLKAFVTGGRWAATCECGESYYVEPSDPIGYCYGGCGNAVLNGAAREIIFPKNIDEIEAVLLEREIDGVPTAISRLGTQAVLYTNLIKPKDAPRNWDGETVNEMRKEHKKIKGIVAEIKKQREVKNG